MPKPKPDSVVRHELVLGKAEREIIETMQMVNVGKSAVTGLGTILTGMGAILKPVLDNWPLILGFYGVSGLSEGIVENATTIWNHYTDNPTLDEHLRQQDQKRADHVETNNGRWPPMNPIERRIRILSDYGFMEGDPARQGATDVPVNPAVDTILNWLISKQD